MGRDHRRTVSPAWKGGGGKSGPGAVGLDERSRSFQRAGFQLRELLVVGAILWDRVAVCFLQGSVSLYLNLAWWGPGEAFGENISMNSERRTLLRVFIVAC